MQAQEQLIVNAQIFGKLYALRVDTIIELGVYTIFPFYFVHILFGGS